VTVRTLQLGRLAHVRLSADEALLLFMHSANVGIEVRLGAE
jgi:hypothetical protein